MDVVFPHPVGPTNTQAATVVVADGALAVASELQTYDRYGLGVAPLAVASFWRWGPGALL